MLWRRKSELGPQDSRLDSQVRCVEPTTPDQRFAPDWFSRPVKGRLEALVVEVTVEVSIQPTTVEVAVTIAVEYSCVQVSVGVTVAKPTIGIAVQVPVAKANVAISIEIAIEDTRIAVAIGVTVANADIAVAIAIATTDRGGGSNRCHHSQGEGRGDELFHRRSP